MAKKAKKKKKKDKKPQGSCPVCKRSLMRDGIMRVVFCACGYVYKYRI